MFGIEVVLVVSSKYNRRLVVREKSGSVELYMKNLRNRKAKL